MNVIIMTAKIVSLACIVTASIVLLGTVGSLELNVLTCTEAMTRSALAFLVGLLGIATAVLVDRVEAVK